MIYYQDEKIIIRDICSEDLVDLFICHVDKEINLHDPRPLPNTSMELLEDCKDYCKRFDTEIMNEKIEDRVYKYFIVTDRGGKFIGFVNFFSIDKIKKQGEMGVIIGDKRCLKKGIAFTAVSTAVNYIFNNMDIDRIYIETGENNIPALNLFSKLNFKKCGECFEDDNFKFIVMEKRRTTL